MSTVCIFRGIASSFGAWGMEKLCYPLESEREGEGRGGEGGEEESYLLGQSSLEWQLLLMLP